ncbi:MAG: NMD3-related protein [archaeon]|nr:NMD3-related protein [archaeon]
MTSRSLSIFCPKCGSENKKLFNGFCIECLLKDKKLFSIPEKIEIEICSRCNRMRVRGKWVAYSDTALLGLARSGSSFKGLENHELFLQGVEVNDKLGVLMVKISGKVGGEELEVERIVSLRIFRVTCPSCSRVSGSYFEAIFQARFEPKTPKKKIEEKMSEIHAFFKRNEENDPLSRVVKIQFVNNGFDLSIGSKRAVKKASGFFEKQLRERVIVTSDIYSYDRNKGRPIKRYTFCLRF